MIKKIAIAALFLVACADIAFCSSSQAISQPTQSTASFKADIMITEQKPEDVFLLQSMRSLFFEADNSINPARDVYTRSVRQHGGQEVMLLTQDDVRISTLYFKRPAATVNIIYIPGYFFDLTPSKEWAAPFASLFPEFNILSIDWRGFGYSEGYSGFLHKNSFGPNAYHDIQAAIDFIRKENDMPVIVVGFCFGAAMAMHATIEAQKAGKNVADALVLNCLFTRFEDQFNRAIELEPRPLYSLLLNTGIAKTLIEWRSNGCLFDINPIDMIKSITIPCLFEHYTHDVFAQLQYGIDVYNAASCPKMFLQSNEGRHVRIHTKVPFQYRNAFLEFLKKFGFYA